MITTVHRRLLAALAGAAILRVAGAQTAAHPTAAAQTAVSPKVSAPTPAAPAQASATRDRSTTPTARQKSEGTALFARIVESYGGRERVGRVHDLQTRGEVSASTPQGDMTMELQTAIVFPDRISQQVDAPFGRVVMAATPAGAFVAGPTGSQELPPSMKDELIRQVQRIPLFLAQKAEDPALSVWAAGTERIGEVDARILEVRYQGMAVRWFMDPKTARILRAAHTAITPQGDAKIVADYSDFRAVDGFPVAFHMDVTTNGEKDQVLTLEECKVNAGVDPKMFEKPPPPPTPAPQPEPMPTPKAS
jgi:hypothetical protein